jgi:hypothetical protein
MDAMAGLHTVINELKHYLGVPRIRMLDVPCGDMAWMSRFLATRDDVDYTGYDIVPDLIKHHQQTFSDRPWKFYHRDLVAVDSSSLDQFDLIFSRMMLQHLKLVDLVKALTKISGEAGSSTRRRFLFTTTFSSHSVNTDVDVNHVWRFRRLNLEIPPISLGPPLCLQYDGHKKLHFLGLWPLPLQQLTNCVSPVKFNVKGSVRGTLYSCVIWAPPRIPTKP